VVEHCRSASEDMMELQGANMATTILVVEDEALISCTVCDALEADGFNVHHSETADGALRYFEKGYPIDVLFTDINLPGKIDGAELASQVRAMRPELPIVYASGRYTASDLHGLAPRSVFLNKPYNLSEVCTLLHRLAPAEH
jgi:CheY-like chemotaxis protein